MNRRLYLPLVEPSSSTYLETAEFPQSTLYKSYLNLNLAQLMGFLSQLFFPELRAVKWISHAQRA